MIWFLGSYWPTRVARGDFVTLILGSQQASGELVNSYIYTRIHT